MFHLILIIVPSSLVLFVKNRGDVGFVLNEQNSLSMPKVIGRWLLISQKNKES